MLRVSCECGWTCDGDRDAVVRAVTEHSRVHHGRAAPTRDEILSVAVPAPESPDAADRG